MSLKIKNLSNKYGQKLDSAKKSTIDAIKTASKRAIQKASEATGDLIGDRIADKITSAWKSSKHSQNDDANSEIEVLKERYISPENYWWIKVSITL